MTVTVMAVLTFAALDLFGDSVEEARFEQTRQQLERIRVGLIGDSTVRENNVRSSFGYVGDLGAFPAALADLLTQPAGISAYAVSSTARFGTGWNGPYVSATVGSANVSTDAWGTALVYTSSASAATITSRGSDKLAGTTGGTYTQDLSVTISSADFRGNVHGFVNTDGRPYNSNTIEVYLRSANSVTGAVRTTSSGVIATTQNGYFSFSNVPYGKRSVTIYIPSQAAASTTIGPIVFTLDSPNLEISESALDTNP